MAKGITHTGHVVEIEDDVMGVVNEIHDRWPDLRVQYLDPERFPDLADAPFQIVDSTGYGDMQVWQLDRRVVDQLSLRDRSQRDLKALVDKEFERSKREKEAVEGSVRAEKKDVLNHIFRSPKGSYTFKNDRGETVKVSDG